MTLKSHEKLTVTFTRTQARLLVGCASQIIPKLSRGPIRTSLQAAIDKLDEARRG